LYKGKDRYDARRPFRPWLFSIASRLVIDRLRARKRHQEVALEATIDTRPESRSLIDILPDASFMKPQDIMEKTEMVQQVREALDGLPENQRIAVLLVRFDEMSYVEVAHTMDLSIAAIKSLLFRAKQTLKRILAPMERRELEWIPIFKERTIRPPAKQTSEIALNN
jgi:RNA polymerase sigma-70 factor (ECF subfamily)